MTVLKLKLQRLTTEYQDKVKELGNQITEVSAIEQKHYESLQVEAAKRHKLVLKDSAARHEELMRLLATQPSSSMPMMKTQAIPHVPVDHTHWEVQNGHIRGMMENKGKGMLPVPPRETNLVEENIEGRLSNKRYNYHHTCNVPDFGI